MEEIVSKSIALVGSVILLLSAIAYGMSLLQTERQSISAWSAQRHALQPLLERSESNGFVRPVISGAELHYIEAFGHWDGEKVYLNKKSALALPHETFSFRWQRDVNGDISHIHVAEMGK
jgi:hypothetical protein